MKDKKIKWIGAAALSLVLIAVAAPSAFTEPAVRTLTASVVSQVFRVEMVSTSR